MSRLIGRLGVAACLALAFVAGADAQNAFPTPAGSNATGAVVMCRSTANTSLMVPCDATNPLPVSATASISGFAPGGAFATLTATGSSASVALPAGATVVFHNTGTTAVSCTLGVGSATALVSENIIQPSSWMAFTVGANTFGACIDQSGSASNVVVLSGGSGLATGSGGGGGGGGAGDASAANQATQITAANLTNTDLGGVTETAPATDTASSGLNGRLQRIAQRLTSMIALLPTALGAGGGLKVDGSGTALPVNCTSGCSGSGLGYITSTLTGWTSGTAGNSTQTMMPISSTYAAAILVQLDQTTTISAGAVTFEGTYDGTNWVTVPPAQVLNPNTFAALTNPYTLVASTNQPFLILTQGYQGVRIRLSTAITGSATVTPFVTLLPFLPVDPALLMPLAAGTNTIGKLGIDQSAVGTTDSVTVKAGSSIQSVGGTTGGNSTTGNIGANNTTAVVVKASAGTLYGAQLGNIGAGPAYLKIYNATSATCGSGTPVKRLIIPKSATAADGGGSNISFGDVGIAFGTGITYCLTTGITDADTTAPAASTVLVNLDWK